MSIRNRHARAMLGVAITALLLSGCQSLPTGAGLDVARTMPGVEAQTRHAHILSAMRHFDASLSGKTVKLDRVHWDIRTGVATESGRLTFHSSDAASLQALAEQTLFDRGPYRLVSADTSNGRLEYRSLTTAEHVSIWVRKPHPVEASKAIEFVVVDLYGQAALSDMFVRQAHGTGEVVGSDTSPLQTVSIRTGQVGLEDDSALLAHFEALPEPEQTRRDILALRVLLHLRRHEDKQAGRLIEQGMIRYPNSPMFFNLALELFDRSLKVSEPPAALTQIMYQRFSRKRIVDNRRDIDRFLHTATHSASRHTTS